MDSQNTLAPSIAPLLIPRSGRRRFLISFTCLTVIGFMTGWLITAIMGQAIDLVFLNRSTEQFLQGILPIRFLFQLLLEGLYEQSNDYEGLVSLLKEVCIGLLLGATLGTAQWFELRRYLNFSPLWILANSLGYTATSNLFLLILVAKIPQYLLEQIPAYALSYLPPSLNHSPAGFIPLIGLAFLGMSVWKSILIGVPQWLVLRRSLRSIWWWVFVLIASGTIASIVSILSMIVSRFVSSGNFDVMRNLTTATFTINSIAYGIIQGVSLCACRRR